MKALGILIILLSILWLVFGMIFKREISLKAKTNQPVSFASIKNTIASNIKQGFISFMVVLSPFMADPIFVLLGRARLSVLCGVSQREQRCYNDRRDQMERIC